MARINYCDDEDFPGQFDLWNGNIERSCAGYFGQWALKELETALLALPKPRLVRKALADDGDVCAVGCLVLALREKRGHDRAAVLADLQTSDPDDDDAAERMAVPLGVPRLVVWKLVALNDIECESRWDPVRQRSEDMTPEERFDHVLAWVRSHLARAEGAD